MTETKDLAPTICQSNGRSTIDVGKIVKDSGMD